MIKKINIGWRLGIGFALIILLLASVTIIGINRMELLSMQTVMMYEHPHTVSNAVLRINTNIIKIHRSMKDVVLAQDIGEIEEAVNIVGKLEREVYKDFRLINEQFLGEKKLFRKTVQEFRAWKPIRDHVISLMHADEVVEAVKITKGVGALHIIKIEEAMEALSDFAETKADEFLNTTQEVKAAAFYLLYVLLFVSIFAGIVVAYYLTRSINVPLKALRSAVDIIGRGNLDYKIDIATKDEIGQLAESFNNMTNDLRQAEKELNKKNVLVQLLQEVAVVANESSSSEEALQSAIDLVCQYLSWPVGHVYMLSKDSRTTLVPTSIWSMVDEERFKDWHDETMKTNFDKGVGLIGGVLASVKPTWIIDVRSHPTFVRRKIAQDLGVKSGFAFPVMVRDEVEAVLEFFTSETVQPYSELMEIMASIGAQLGRVIERKNASEILKQSRDTLEVRVKERTAELTDKNERMSNALFRAEEVLGQLAKAPLSIPFFTTSQMYRTSRAVGGGDTLRWVQFRSRYAGIYLHDVSGHNIEETLLNILATALADYCKLNPQKKTVSLPSLFLTDMNRELIKFCKKTGHFITAVYALMDFTTREIKLSLAGHPTPWLINADGSVEEVGEQGVMMGQFDVNPADDNRYRDTSLKLKADQLLLIYSDGLMEAKDENGVDFESKFRSHILKKLNGMEPDRAYSMTKSEFKSHLNGRKPEDDVSFIFIGSRPAEKYDTLVFKPGPQLLKFIKKHKQYVCPIPEEKEAGSPSDTTDLKNVDSEQSIQKINKLSDTYKLIIDKISRDGWPVKKINEIEVALGELVINAIMHGNLASDRYIVQINHILHNGTLEVSVIDEGRGFDGSMLPQTIEKDDLLKESGRGFSMIGMYADNMHFNDMGNKCWVIFKKDGTSTLSS